MKGIRPAAVSVILLAALCVSACGVYRGAHLYQRGTASLDRGETQRAISELEQAVIMVPNASEIQNHLGLAYAAAGRERDALGAFRRAVELDCDNLAASENLAFFEAQSVDASPREATP